MTDNPISISNWFAGGLSDSKWSGTKDSLYRMVGTDPHSEPAVLKAEQKLTKYSGAIIDEFVKYQVVSSNGRTYHFSGDSGKIWEIDSGGTCTLVLTTTAGAGEVKCLGAYEYQGYIIWCTELRMHRILATDAEGATEWAANKVLNWQTFTIGSKLYHPMVEQNLNLYIGNGYLLTEIDDAWAFTEAALDIPTSLVIKCLGKLPIGTDVLIGTEGVNDVTKTAIFRWNTWSVSFISSDDIPEVGINAFIPADNSVYVSAGKYGNIYTYDGVSLSLYKKVPGSYSPTYTCTVHPDAGANLDGQILFGVSNVSNNPCLEGVYRIGRNSTNYPWIMDLAYPISERSGTDLVLSGIEIGSVVVVGQKILVSWKHGATYGVDQLDASNKLNGAYFETRVMRPDRLSYSTFSHIAMAYNSLPASTALTVSYDKNYAGSYTTPTSSQVIDVDRKIITLGEGIEATAVQMKVVFTCSGNDTPSLEEMDIFLE